MNVRFLINGASAKSLSFVNHLQGEQVFHECIFILSIPQINELSVFKNTNNAKLVLCTVHLLKCTNNNSMLFEGLLLTFDRSFVRLNVTENVRFHIC